MFKKILNVHTSTVQSGFCLSLEEVNIKHPGMIIWMLNLGQNQQQQKQAMSWKTIWIAWKGSVYKLLRGRLPRHRGKCDFDCNFEAFSQIKSRNKIVSFFCYSQAAEHLQSFIADCDRRTELAKKRLAETQDEISAEVAAKVERIYFVLCLFFEKMK